MYHSISDDIWRDSHPYYEINTSPALFESHMRYLRENGYSTIGMHELKKNQAGLSLIEKPVILTFDDGYADFYSQASPILEKYGFKAVVFLVTGFIKNGNRGRLNGKEILTWEEIRVLTKSGTSFGSHSVNHPLLQKLSESDLEFELRQSKADVEDNIGESIDAFSNPFAFPYGDKLFCELYINLLRASGYRFGVTTIVGRNPDGCDFFQIRRLPINQHDDLLFFRAKLEGGYDWISNLQYIKKYLKSK
jgi:peptidoglycan/xylan/chitin deacetylase (PgdA/CDA1 family)